MAARAARTPATELLEDGIGLDELAGEAARWAVLAVAGLAAGLLVVAISLWNPIPAALFWLVAGLSAVAAAGWLARRAGPAPTAAVLCAGLGAVLLLGAASLGPELLAPWSSVVVLTAAALVGWRAGALTALAVTAGLALPLPWAVRLPAELALNAGLLSWSGLFLYWLISRPTRTALDWAWHSYHEALDRTVEARQRQAELARASKSLADYAYRLEQLNLELAQARRAADEARKLKEQFAAAVSHELRTPLNLILGFCEMMVLSPRAAYGQPLPPGYRADVEAMYRNAVHISSLVDDILDLSQIDAGRMALHREWVRLAEVVDEAVATVETLFSNRQLTLRSAVPAALPPVFADPTRVRQVLINLLSNAARHVRRGGVVVRAEGRERAVVLAVSDTGPGIAPEELRHVFDEFRQLGAPAGPRVGSGLGLTVSKRFVEMHGGTMWAESVLAQGSTFFLELPLGPADDAPAAGSGDWGDRAAGRVRGELVRRLVVFDDDGDVRRVFQRHLDDVEVVDGRGYADALARGRARPVHAAVLGAPKGAARWKRLVERWPELARVPVISCPLSTARRTAERLGVAHCLVKPVTRAQLRSVLRRLNGPVRSVLVVDDSAEMTHLLGRMIESVGDGCRVRTASDGRAALAAIRAERPDLLLLDLLMPELDGYAVLDALAGDPALRDLPVVLVTARGTHSETIVAERLSVERPDGLSVGETMLWIKAGLEALLGPRERDPAPAAGPPA
jgi:signal transduction histidine kinase